MLPVAQLPQVTSQSSAMQTMTLPAFLSSPDDVGFKHLSSLLVNSEVDHLIVQQLNRLMYEAKIIIFVYANTHTRFLGRTDNVLIGFSKEPVKLFGPECNFYIGPHPTFLHHPDLPCAVISYHAPGTLHNCSPVHYYYSLETLHVTVDRNRFYKDEICHILTTLSSKWSPSTYLQTWKTEREYQQQFKEIQATDIIVTTAPTDSSKKSQTNLLAREKLDQALASVDLQLPSIKPSIIITKQPKKTAKTVSAASCSKSN